MAAGKSDDSVVRSEFSIAVYILSAILLLFSGFATYHLVTAYRNEAGSLNFAILAFCIGLLDLFAFLNPLFACYNVSYDGEYLVYRWTFLPRMKKVHAEKIDGFYTMKVPSREDEYLTAYPACGDKLLPSISSFYFSNYDDIVKHLPGARIKEIPFKWGTYFRMSILGKKPL